MTDQPTGNPVEQLLNPPAYVPTDGDKLRNAMYEVSSLLAMSRELRDHAQSIGGQQNASGANLMTSAVQLDAIAAALTDKAIFEYRKATQ